MCVLLSADRSSNLSHYLASSQAIGTNLSIILLEEVDFWIRIYHLLGLPNRGSWPFYSFLLCLTVLIIFQVDIIPRWPGYPFGRLRVILVNFNQVNIRSIPSFQIRFYLDFSFQYFTLKFW